MKLLIIICQQGNQAPRFRSIDRWFRKSFEAAIKSEAFSINLLFSLQFSFGPKGEAEQAMAWFQDQQTAEIIQMQPKHHRVPLLSAHLLVIPDFDSQSLYFLASPYWSISSVCSFQDAGSWQHQS